jgi:hypothetical protein
MFPWWPKAMLPGLCLSLIAALCPEATAANPVSGPGVPAPQTVAAAPADPSAPAGPAAPPSPATKHAAATPATDPFLAAMLGILPLGSGFYVTSTPQKGIVFTLADAMLIGTIMMIRSDDSIPPKDVANYYYLLGAVNLADLALSLLQARNDAAVRLNITLNQPDRPGVALAWRF